jgi:hypothetical protein
VRTPHCFSSCTVPLFDEVGDLLMDPVGELSVDARLPVIAAGILEHGIGVCGRDVRRDAGEKRKRIAAGEFDKQHVEFTVGPAACQWVCERLAFVIEGLMQSLNDGRCVRFGEEPRCDRLDDAAGPEHVENRCAVVLKQRCRLPPDVVRPR